MNPEKNRSGLTFQPTCHPVRKSHLEPPVEAGKPRSDMRKPTLYRLSVQGWEDVTLTVRSLC